MKGMNGLDVLKKLRELDGKARVIVVSADVQDSSRELAAAGGAVGFLNKPVDRDGAAERWWRRRWRERSTWSSPRSSRTRSSSC